ncbi:hypothetical protein GHT06_020067 [Daphnia sinensis]|uniref:Uncharacterized protein n=1 Tax=Daphnia sinensis TaxID=1820382 RepID=A0AAD5PTP2_9CRUS|nr:hypothetical protein GHT06_020067 [Daphnia sinensis]
MVGWTWPTKDDESSSETEQKSKSQAQQQNRSHKHDGQSSESEDQLDEKVTSVPLRLVLFPTEDELSLSQMTPSSSLRALNCNQNSSSRIRFDGEEKSSNNLQPEEMWQQCYEGSDADDSHKDPQWANQDSKVSFYVSQSFPSPANSPELEEIPLLEEPNSDKDVVWQNFGEESRLALCTEDMGSELERLEVQCNRFC